MLTFESHQALLSEETAKFQNKSVSAISLSGKPVRGVALYFSQNMDGETINADVRCGNTYYPCQTSTMELI